MKIYFCGHFYGFRLKKNQQQHGFCVQPGELQSSVLACLLSDDRVRVFQRAERVEPGRLRAPGSGLERTAVSSAQTGTAAETLREAGERGCVLTRQEVCFPQRKAYNSPSERIEQGKVTALIYKL